MIKMDTSYEGHANASKDGAIAHSKTFFFRN